MSDHFYVTLPSDSSQNVFGKQTPSNFTTALAQEIALQHGEWEVGVSEFTYGRNWENMSNCNFTIKHTDPDSDVVAGSAYQLPPQRCQDGRELTEAFYKAVNKTLGPGNKSQIGVGYDGLRDRVELRVNEGYELSLSPKLALLLGYGYRTVLNVKAGTSYPPHAPNPHRVHLNMNIYSDIAEHVAVGHIRAPLLRTVTDSGTVGDNAVTERFNPVHYVGLSKSRFDTIHLRICDEFGSDVSFAGGRTIVTLHFKRRS